MSKFPSEPASPFFHISVHDVTPDSLPKVRRILRVLHQHAYHDVTLLVVPGLHWDSAGLAQLRDWAQAGHTLAGHGWRHRTEGFRNLAHLLHSLLISRNVAEHLELDAAGIQRLILRCHAWFANHDLPSPSLYVPPAWAMGRIRRAELAALPFERYEYLTGFYAVRDERFSPMPLVGFEADSWSRLMSLYPLNALNLALSRMTGSLRVALHPDDLDLLMGRSLRSMLDAGRFSGARHAPGNAAN